MPQQGIRLGSCPGGTGATVKGAPSWDRAKLWELLVLGSQPEIFFFIFYFLKDWFNDMLCIHPLKIQPVLGIFNLGFYSYYCLILNCFFLITS